MVEQMIETLVGRLTVTVLGDRGPTAVLWHSLFVDERSWRGMLPRLAKRRRLVVITGPGHGASSDPERRYIVTRADHHGFTPEQAQGAVDMLARGRLAILPDTAYLAPLEAPAASADLVLAQWADVRAGETP